MSDYNEHLPLRKFEMAWCKHKKIEDDRIFFWDFILFYCKDGRIFNSHRPILAWVTLELDLEYQAS